MSISDPEMTGNAIVLSDTERSNGIKKMVELDNKRTKLNEEIKKFSNTIKPIEFESYYEFFLINTFKKGISASGHVDIESLRSRNNGMYYRKLKRSMVSSTRGSNTPNSNNALSDNEDNEDEEDDDTENERDHRSSFFVPESETTIDESKNGSTKRVTRAQLAARKESEKDIEVQEKQLEKSDRTLINGDISVTSIIMSNETDGSIRRSSRLSQKSVESSMSGSSGTTLSDVNTTQIKDLYESLVPKVKDPYRRSDWVLPSRNRYTPEKQMRTKHSHEIVKVNELVDTDRIRSVLSKFEGGVAGIRKRS